MAFDNSGRFEALGGLVNQINSDKQQQQQQNSANTRGIVSGGMKLVGTILSFIPGLQPVGIGLGIAGGLVGGQMPSKDQVGQFAGSFRQTPRQWNAPFTVSQGPVSYGG